MVTGEPALQPARLEQSW